MTEQERMEANIRETINLSKKVFYEGLEDHACTWTEFIARQFRFVRKRWWILQFFVLVIMWAIMRSKGGEPQNCRYVFLLMPVFGMIIVPELWKDVRNNMTEIENTACFTLRQIYAARLTIFGMADLLLLTLFFIVTTVTVHFALFDIIVQCIIPLNVTMCICLGILCGQRFRSESVALGLCIVWTLVWHQIISNNRLYYAISKLLWAGLLALTSAGLLVIGNHLLQTSHEASCRDSPKIMYVK